MNVAFLKLGYSIELTIMKNNRIPITRSIEKHRLLTDVFKYLKAHSIDEMRLVCEPQIVDKFHNDHYELGSFRVGNLDKVCLVNKDDVEKIMILCRDLNIPTLTVYSVLDIFENIGKDIPTIIFGEYFSDIVSYFYVNENGIQEHRIGTKNDISIVKQMAKQYDVSHVLSSCNLYYKDAIDSRIDNVRHLSERDQLLLSHSLGTLFLKPRYTCDINEAFDNTVSDNQPMYVNEDRVEVKEQLSYDYTNTDEEYEEDFEERHGGEKYVASTKSSKPRAKYLKRVLDAVGISVAIALSFSIYTNKFLPDYNDNLSKKKIELGPDSALRQRTAEYYEKYVTNLTEDKGNLEYNVIEKIMATPIPADGILGEIMFNKNNIRILVFLKNAEDIEAYKEALGGAVTIVSATNSGTSSLQNLTLTKFIIDAKM